MSQTPGKTVADAAIIGGSWIATALHWLPEMTAAIGFIWGLICISDWATGGALRAWVVRKVMRR